MRKVYWLSVTFLIWVKSGEDRQRREYDKMRQRNKMTQVKLAEILGITPTTLSFKLNGKSTLSLKECVEIKRKAFPDKTLDYLFATDETSE